LNFNILKIISNSFSFQIPVENCGNTSRDSTSASNFMAQRYDNYKYINWKMFIFAEIFTK